MTFAHFLKMQCYLNTCYQDAEKNFEMIDFYNLIMF